MFAQFKGKKGKSVSARVLLDSGSSSNFILKGRLKSLHYRSLTKSHKIDISTLQGTQTCETSKIEISLLRESQNLKPLKIAAFVVLSLLEVPGVHLPGDLLKEYPLTESFTPRPSFHIDVLIGIKEFWQIALDKPQEITSN